MGIKRWIDALKKWKDKSNPFLELKDDNEDFLIAQYNALRVETMERLKELWQLEKFALGGAAAIAAWILTNVEKCPPDLAWWLPFALVITCLLRFAAGIYHLGYRSSRYLKATESAFLGDMRGWETWFRTQLPNETVAFVLVWSLAVGATFAFPFYRSKAETSLKAKSCTPAAPVAAQKKGERGAGTIH